VKVSLRVGRDAVIEIFVLVLDAGQERTYLARIVEGKTQHTAAPMRIAAPHLPRRLFQNDNALGTGFARRYGGSESGIPGSDHDHVVRLLLPVGHWRYPYFGHYRAIRRGCGRHL
jgi:hypothetical protein